MTVKYNSTSYILAVNLYYPDPMLYYSTDIKLFLCDLSVSMCMGKDIVPPQSFDVIKRFIWLPYTE